MKQREPRIKVLIGARMRAGAAWGDVCLLNLSSRGVLAQAAFPPCTGSYIEFRRGPHIIVARVVWAEKHRFGALAQDRIGVDALIAHASGSKSNAACAEADPLPNRRAPGPQPAHAVQHDNSRLVGRAIEFCFLVGSGAMLAGLAFSLVQEGVAAPMSQVSAALSPQ